MTLKNKIFLCFGFWVLGFGLANSQNLIPNPSYEYTVNCPTGVSQFNSCSNWTNPTQASPDYFNACSTANGGVASVPKNGFGFQNTKTGNAYAGFYTGGPSTPGSDYREYVQVALTTTLTVGKVYFVSFYVNLSNWAKYATSKIGAYLSATAPARSDMKVIIATPQIQNSLGFITDTINWVKISGNYTALGDEQYITIGNFYNDANTDTLNLGGTGFSAHYYYIDDVSIIDSATGINEYLSENIFIIYPNPTNGKVYVTGFGAQEKAVNIEVSDVTGKLLAKQQYVINSGIVELNLQLNNGVYFIRITNSTGNQMQKIIINN